MNRGAVVGGFTIAARSSWELLWRSGDASDVDNPIPIEISLRDSERLGGVVLGIVIKGRAGLRQLDIPLAERLIVAEIEDEDSGAANAEGTG